MFAQNGFIQNENVSPEDNRQVTTANIFEKRKIKCCRHIKTGPIHISFQLKGQ